MFIKLFCLFLVIFTTCNADLTQEQIEKFSKIADNCKEKTGATDEEVGQLMKHIIPDSNSALCFTACVKKQLGVINDDNTLNIEKIEEIIKPIQIKNSNLYDGITEVVKTCTDKVVVVDDECETSKNIMECFTEKFKENNLQADIMSLVS